MYCSTPFYFYITLLVISLIFMHMNTSNHSTNSRPQKNSGFCIASLFLGVFSIIGGFLLVIPLLLAIIFGHIGLSNVRSQNLKGKGLGIAGLIMGYFSICLWILIIMLIPLSTPIFLKKFEEIKVLGAKHNALQIYSSLTTYPVELGDFPSTGLKDSSANDHFRIIFDYDKTITETVFFSFSSKWATLPDNITKGDQCLIPGENVYAYVPEATFDDTACPLILSPFGTDGKIDTEEFGNLAIVVNTDGIAQTYSLSPDEPDTIKDDEGNILYQNGMVFSINKTTGKTKSYKIALPDFP